MQLFFFNSVHVLSIKIYGLLEIETLEKKNITEKVIKFIMVNANVTYIS